MFDIRDKARRDNLTAATATIQLARQTRSSRIHKWRSLATAPQLLSAAVPWLVSAGSLGEPVYGITPDSWLLCARGESEVAPIDQHTSPRAGAFLRQGFLDRNRTLRLFYCGRATLLPGVRAS